MKTYIYQDEKIAQILGSRAAGNELHIQLGQSRH